VREIFAGPVSETDPVATLSKFDKFYFIYNYVVMAVLFFWFGNCFEEFDAFPARSPQTAPERVARPEGF
jgi:hypothetical protein